MRRRPRFPTRPFAATAFCTLQQEARAARTPADWRWRWAYQWAVAAVAGLAAGCAAFAANYLTQCLQILKFEAAARHAGPGGAPRLLLAAGCGCLPALCVTGPLPPGR